MEAYVGRIIFVVLLIGVYTASAYPSERALEEELREYLAEKEDERGFNNFAPENEDVDSNSIERDYIARLLEENAVDDPAMQSFDEMDEDEDDGLERELPSFDMPVDEGENMIPDFEQEEYLRNANEDGDFKDAFDEESFFNYKNRELGNDFDEGEDFEENSLNDEVNDAEQEYVRRNNFDEDDGDEEEMSDFQRQEYERMANEQADRLNDEYMQKSGGFDDWEQDQRNIKAANIFDDDDDDEPDDNGFTKEDRALLEQLVQTIKTEKAEGATDEEIEKELETLGSL